MKRKTRVLALILAAALLCALIPAAGAAEAVTPTPPSWCPAEEYAVFDDTQVYVPVLWDKVLRLRELAVSGGMGIKPGTSSFTTRDEYDLYAYEQIGDIGACFEYGLLKLMDNNAKGTGGSSSAQHYFNEVLSALSPDDPRYAIVGLWQARATVQWLSSFQVDLHSFDADLPGYGWLQAFASYLRDNNVSLNRVLDTPALSAVSAERRAEVAALLEQEKNTVYVILDEKYIHPTTVNGEYSEAQARGGRTMIPIRHLAEAIGADVAWDGAAQKVTLTRAGQTIEMTLGSTSAYQNGTPFEMDVAPYAEDGRTYIPVRYMAEFFGQSVVWDSAAHTAYITEDKNAVAPSNLEAWVLPMGSMLGYKNTGHPERFGGSLRSASAKKSAARSLSSSWSIESRADLIDTVLRMTDHGHNDDFLEAANIAKGLNDAQMSQLIAQASATDQYMWPYTKSLAEKWGDKGIIAWDLFRMSNLVQWGYLAGYITYPEALALLEPAAARLKANFSSWDEAYENYLDGYNWWARNDVAGKDVWETERGRLYLEMKADPDIAPIFDDSLFKTGVVPVPGVTADDLAKKIQ